MSGWEGSAADGALFSNSRFTDLAIPEGKFYLADAGFGACDSLLVPYRGVRYHLAEWGRANVRLVKILVTTSLMTDHFWYLYSPTTCEELFNLRHAQARNVIERIFGIIKKRWDILNHPPHFDMSVQARIPPACAALHNFILKHDPCDVDDLIVAHGEPETGGGVEDFGTLAQGHVTRQEKLRAEALRDRIAQEMWDSYEDLLLRRQEEGNFDDEQMDTN